ncbi:MAG: ABC transporter ATP-binding protein [Leptospiraceae bacterium]|nr:ABC transporter ATP-binding protein [Leptospiraceae bacterium]
MNFGSVTNPGEQRVFQGYRSYLGFLWHFSRDSRRWLYLAAASAAPLVLLTIGLPAYIGRFIGDLSAHSREDALTATLVVFAILLLRGALEISNRYCMTRLHTGSLQRIRSHCFERLQRMSLSFHLASRSGESGHLIGFDARLAAMGLLQQFQLIVLYPPQLLGLLLLLFYYDVQIAVLSLTIFPAALLGTALLGRKARSSERKFLEADARMMGFAIETLTNVRQIQSMGIESERREQLDLLDARAIFWHQRSAILQSLPGPFAETMIGVGMVLLLLLLAYARGFMRLDFALVALCISALMMMRGPLRGFAAALIESQGARMAVQRLLWTIGGLEDNELQTMPAAFQGRITEICLHDIAFQFENRAPVLQHINACFRAGGLHVVYGASGAGKTTLMDIVAGLYPPNTGRIEIQGTQLDLQNLAAWRRQTGLVSQESLLFDDTIRNNISMGRNDIDESQISQVCHQAGLTDLLQRLPDGLDSNIGEYGRKLSGGERKRVSLARALMRNPQVLILDELTAELDMDSEQVILETLRQLARQYLVIHVSHRLAVREHADHLWLLENGKLIRQTGSGFR